MGTPGAAGMGSDTNAAQIQVDRIEPAPCGYKSAVAV